jgi:dimethylhistidine N-methyltransferase
MTLVRLRDLAPTRQQFLDEVVRGLTGAVKTLPSKYFYDARGSELFDEICDLEEYYLTRTELSILKRFAGEMADSIGPNCAIVEYGSGSSLKTRILLEQLHSPAALIPVEISCTHLKQAAQMLSRKFPELCVEPLCADFTEPFELPKLDVPHERTVLFFPGSTIGNFPPFEAAELLGNMRDLAAPHGGLLIGVDLDKPRHIVEAAYNDHHGVTAAFNLNLLTRINRELSADFELDRFRHEAILNQEEGRIEMHLVSQGEQTVRLNGTEVAFSDGESIHTENSYKYSLSKFGELAESAGFRVERIWCDSRNLFSVQYLSVL